MSIRNANQLKVMLGIITLTSVAALTPSAYAQVPVRAVDNILNRANLNTNTIKLDQQDLKLSPSVEQIQDVSKIRGTEVACDGGGSQNGVCGAKTGRGTEVLTNPAIERNTQLIRSIRGISR
jgi:hypothetical protein